MRCTVAAPSFISVMSSSRWSWAYFAGRDSGRLAFRPLKQPDGGFLGAAPATDRRNHPKCRAEELQCPQPDADSPRAEAVGGHDGEHDDQAQEGNDGDR